MTWNKSLSPPPRQDAPWGSWSHRKPGRRSPSNRRSGCCARIPRPSWLSGDLCSRLSSAFSHLNQVVMDNLEREAKKESKMLSGVLTLAWPLEVSTVDGSDRVGSISGAVVILLLLLLQLLHLRHCLHQTVEQVAKQRWSRRGHCGRYLRGNSSYEQWVSCYCSNSQPNLKVVVK